MYLKNPSGTETVFVLDPKRTLWCEVYVGTAVNIARTPRTGSETDCNLKKIFESGENLLEFHTPYHYHRQKVSSEVGTLLKSS